MLPPSSVVVGGVTIGGGSLVLIAGPCVIESEAHAVETALALRDITRRAGTPFIFKASYDKANRTSGSSFRGPGLAEGVRILGRVREAAGVPILTDIHEPSQAGPVAEVADVLQIPAFLSRQTDLLTAAARTGRAVNVKKGQFLSPLDMRHADREGHGRGQPQRDRHRARLQFRLQQPRRRHARVPDPAVARLSGRLRRDPQPAAPGRRRRRDGRPGGVHRADGLRRRRRGRGRRVHGSAPGSAAREERRAERAQAGSPAGPARQAGRRFTRSETAPRWPDEPDHDDLAGACAQGAADRGGRHPRPGRSARRRLRARAAAALRMPRPRDRHRDGQVGHHLPEDGRDTLEHRHLRLLPASRGSDSRGSRRHPGGRRGRGAVAQRGNRGARPAARIHPADRRQGHFHHRLSPLDSRRRRPTSPSTAGSPKRPAR